MDELKVAIEYQRMNSVMFDGIVEDSSLPFHHNTIQVAHAMRDSKERAYVHLSALSALGFIFDNIQRKHWLGEGVERVRLNSSELFEFMKTKAGLGDLCLFGDPLSVRYLMSNDEWSKWWSNDIMPHLKVTYGQHPKPKAPATLALVPYNPLCRYRFELTKSPGLPYRENRPECKEPAVFSYAIQPSDAFCVIEIQDIEIKR